MSKKHLRKRFYVDRNVQGAIAARAARYWMLSISVVAMITIIGWVFWAPGVAALVESPEKLAAIVTCLAIALLAAIVLTPVVLYDLLKFTHRFAGPMVRLKDSMERVAAGEKVPPIRFRDDDYWQDFADAFNNMQAQLQDCHPAETSVKADA